MFSVLHLSSTHLGADRQIRTADLILTKDALYRLSYISITAPILGTIITNRQTPGVVKMATRKGLEPSTSGVTGRRSNQLNYRAILNIKTDHSVVCLAGAEGIEPSARGFGDRCSTS